ncbi:efflux RND transporter periplasmic adaptor subunit [Trinickia caryophylli]|uniref:RND family efflux transporter, MFP subunit n=1 Tax=Trinickia caryophylli TaxID=28094 RepID=A0A1X7GIS1_TRICW|nr:efflux RND transporter periplasmic adaptor subunit [Trinickia caryophylli]PMS09895.1 efflux RND transporter periplasmic adaptor subunit [Trinickia caryophylli]TRX14931.1 efflux RND transporter periplasmic adaptor subunit [Trinickia caryophylli]WQE14785.1 efflux RND transporter periplasmic adaptor subunit [Trinickia caryophylli]SMF70431.1 RND family efflux transporter, MFP subunit [Trinickia caryophylli]GLU34985.1 RND transporter MFP subunit [Trinickia caryophylli]
MNTSSKPSLPARAPATRGKRHWKLAATLGVAAAAALALGIAPRLQARSALRQQTARERVTTVSIVEPKPASTTGELLLPGTAMPFADASIYARTSGYVRHWYTDIGTNVHAGETLAVIETPELDAQLRQAQADEALAEANYAFARSTAARWQQMLETQSVSQQDADLKTSDMRAKAALLASARANVARLTELVSYEKVTAPFDGVVTARDVDVGALVTAGGSPGLAATSGELFRVSDTTVLRVFVNVPQYDAAAVKPGASVYLTTDQYPGRHFAARLARTADAIDPATRTLRAEIDVDNQSATLLSGAYVQVHLALAGLPPALELPASALLFRPGGVQVAVAGSDGKAHLKTVVLGRDSGTRVAIASGLAATDRVIDNPGDATTDGEPVRIVAAAHAS